MQVGMKITKQNKMVYIHTYNDQGEFINLGISEVDAVRLAKVLSTSDVCSTMVVSLNLDSAGMGGKFNNDSR